MNVGLFNWGNLLDSDDENDGEPPARRPRIFRPRTFDRLDNVDTRKRFRLSLDHVELLFDRIGGLIAHRTEKNCALTVRQQIFVSLRYLATGDSFNSVGDAQGVSKSTVSRSVHRFVNAVNRRIYPSVVDWPRDQQTLNGIANKFMNDRGMPCVFGCIDGTYCQIVSPKVDEPQFIDRHQHRSLNAMVVCGPTMRFYYVSSRWPGSVHDARVFRNSSLKRRLDTGWRPFPQGVLLGDSAYPDSNYLVTPVPDPRNRSERRYNKVHKKTRNLVECAIGILKQRFRCLFMKKMHLIPTFAAKVILCCAALHNLLMDDDEAAAELDEFDRVHHADDDHDYVRYPPRRSNEETAAYCTLLTVEYRDLCHV